MRMYRTARLFSPFLLLAALGASACEKEPSPPAPRERLSGYVLLPLGTGLYHSASASPALITRTFPYKYDDPPWVSQFRVVSDKGEWIEVANIARSQAKQCYRRSIPGLHNAELHFFVRRKDLNPVLKRSFVKKFPDDTKIELKAGVAVSVIQGSNRSRVTVNDIALEFPLPASSIGKSFALKEFFATQGDTDDPAEEATLPVISGSNLAAKKLKIGGDIAVISLESSPKETTVRHLSSTETGDLVRLRRNCLQVEAVIPKTLLEPPKDPNYVSGVLGGYGYGVIFHFLVSAEAPIYWRGGTQAGKLLGEMGFDISAANDGKRQCFLHTLPTTPIAQGMPGTTLELCFDPSDVIENVSE